MTQNGLCWFRSTLGIATGFQPYIRSLPPRNRYWNSGFSRSSGLAKITVPADRRPRSRVRKFDGKDQTRPSTRGWRTAGDDDSGGGGGWFIGQKDHQSADHRNAVLSLPRPAERIIITKTIICERTPSDRRQPPFGGLQEYAKFSGHFYFYVLLVLQCESDFETKRRGTAGMTTCKTRVSVEITRSPLLCIVPLRDKNKTSLKRSTKPYRWNRRCRKNFVGAI